jgi:hypothetical protein
LENGRRSNYDAMKQLKRFSGVKFVCLFLQILGCCFLLIAIGIAGYILLDLDKFDQAFLQKRFGELPAGYYVERYDFGSEDFLTDKRWWRIKSHNDFTELEKWAKSREKFQKTPSHECYDDLRFQSKVVKRVTPNWWLSDCALPRYKYIIVGRGIVNHFIVIDRKAESLYIAYESYW